MNMVHRKKIWIFFKSKICEKCSPGDPNHIGITIEVLNCKTTFLLKPHFFLDYISTIMNI